MCIRDRGTGRATLVKFEQEFPFIRSEITPVDEEEMQMPEPEMCIRDRA